MKTYKASQAKQWFGEVLIEAAKKPVIITKHTRPVVYIMSKDHYQGMIDKIEKYEKIIDRNIPLL